MKTILLISPYYQEQHRWMVSTVKLAELWQRLGYRVVIACMGQSQRIERVSDTLEIHRLPDYFLPDPWNYGISLGFSGYVMRLAAQCKPDLIIVNKILFWTSFSLLRLRLSGHRVLLLSDALVGMTWWPRSLIAKIGAAVYAWTAGWILLLAASHVVFFHPQPPSLLRRLRIASKTSVIPTGIDVSLFPSVRQRDQSSLGRNVTVTYIGRLESVKGVDDFLAASTKIQKDYPQLFIQVVGFYKPDNELVKAFAGRVTFTGLQPDSRLALSSTDIFVLPSYAEGLSNALMEAMSSSCACIASDVGGNRYLLQNGVSGFLFPVGDREALASHIRRLVEDPQKRFALGIAARKRIEQTYSWDIVAKQYSTLFARFL